MNCNGCEEAQHDMQPTCKVCGKINSGIESLKDNVTDHFEKTLTVLKQSRESMSHALESIDRDIAEMELALAAHKGRT